MANLSCPYSTGIGENSTIDVSGIERVRWTGICILADVMFGCGNILNKCFDYSYSKYIPASLNDSRQLSDQLAVLLNIAIGVS